MRISLLSILFLLASCSSSDESKVSGGDGELWVMIKIDSNFRSEKDLEVVDDIAKEIEGKNLGVLDGHSSGAYQLDFNFSGIRNFDQAKSVIESSMDRIYPAIEYTVSTSYELKYEKL